MIRAAVGASLGIGFMLIVAYFTLREVTSQAEADQVARDFTSLLGVIGTWVLDGLGDLRRVVFE